MKTLDPEERIYLAFSHEEPDRVPAYEGQVEIPELVGTKPISLEPGILFFGASFLKYITAPWARPLRRLFSKAITFPSIITSVIEPFARPLSGSITRIYRKLKIDLIGMVGGLPMIFNPSLLDAIRITGNVVLSPAGDIATEIPGGKGAVTRHGFLRSPEDYERYMAFDPENPLNTFLTGKMLDAARGKFALVFSVYGSAFFENMCDLFGYNTLFKLMIKEPAFIKKVVNDMSDYATTVATRMLDQGARYFYMTDDLGQKGRMLISPRMYRTFFKDGVKKFCDFIHAGGGKVMMHSDGNVMDVLPDLVEVGIDALHPWEASAGMDIAAGKRRWGDKLVLVGNVPIELLSHGTPDGVDSYVRDLMNNVAPGGGYIIASSHSVVPSVKYENYRAYMLARMRYGKYPELTSRSP